MSYLNRYALTNDAELKKRVQMAVWIAAVGILSESTSTPAHTERVEWAGKQLRGPMGTDDERRMMILISANGTIGLQGNAASDNAIQLAVNDAITKIVVAREN